MEYQEIVTAYNKKDLDTSKFKKKLEISKPLKGRPRYRAVDIINNSLTLNNEITYLITMPENEEKAEKFLESLDILLNDYFANLIESIKYCKAWDIIGLVPKGWSQTEFETVSKANKFKLLYDINKKYYKFLEYQKIADIRDFVDYDINLNENKITRLFFLILMFDNFKNQIIKDEFFCFDKDFLMALINFKKSKKLRIEDYMKEKKAEIQDDYEKYSRYFSTKDFREIIENLTLTSKTLKVSLNRVIGAFCELSESETEKSQLSDDFKELKKLEKKYIIMSKLKGKADEERAKQEKIIEEKKKQEAIKKFVLEKTQKEKDATEKEIKNKITNIQNQIPKNISITPKANPKKEQVNPMVFTWFEKEDITLARRISLKKMNAFFDKIKQIQIETGVRVSLFLVTNSDEETTLRRLTEIQKKATTQGLEDLVESAFGGYSTFKVDKEGKVTSIARMSDLNRTKIINLLEKPVRHYLSKDLIVNEEKNYLRYQFADRKNRNVTIQYLENFISQLLKDEKIKKQPLKFLPYIERSCSGIDVVLESQLKGIEQLPEYYKTKYCIAPGKIITADVTNIDDFIEDIKINSENVNI